MKELLKNDFWMKNVKKKKRYFFAKFFGSTPFSRVGRETLSRHTTDYKTFSWINRQTVLFFMSK